MHPSFCSSPGCCMLFRDPLGKPRAPGHLDPAALKFAHTESTPKAFTGALAVGRSDLSCSLVSKKLSPPVMRQCCSTGRATSARLLLRHFFIFLRLLLFFTFLVFRRIGDSRDDGGVVCFEGGDEIATNSEVPGLATLTAGGLPKSREGVVGLKVQH